MITTKDKINIAHSFKPVQSYPIVEVEKPMMPPLSELRPVFDHKIKYTQPIKKRIVSKSSKQIVVVITKKVVNYITLLIKFTAIVLEEFTRFSLSAIQSAVCAPSRSSSLFK